LEREIHDRLAEVSPQAVPIFQEATRALDADDLQAARRGYERVLELVPEFPDANRRLSHVYRALDDGQSALTYAERAHSAEPSPYNEQALALALLMVADDQATAERALAHARSAAEALPDEVEPQLTLFFTAGLNDDVETMREASAALKRLAPDALVTHYVAALLAAQDGRWEEAGRELSLAEEAGLPAQEALGLREVIDAASRRRWWMLAGAFALGGWLIAPLLLLAVGGLLSKITLATVRRTQATARFEVSRAERAVRTIYRGVIALSAFYFYLSLPVVALIVTLGAGGILYALYVGPGVPVRLAIGLALLVLYSLYAIVRGIFVRIREQEPGRALAREEAPRLWALAEQVAQRVGTEPIESIYVTPLPTIAVTERGRRWFRPRAAGKRTLFLGLGALNGMTQGQLAAILAHEYGHFSNRDTAGGDLANRTGASIGQIAYSLAASGQARWYNPVWLFLRGFDHLFVRITRGASRLQEILADRYSVQAYGARDFVAGLKQSIRQGVTFHIQAEHEIDAALDQGRALPNLFVLAPPRSEQVREQVEAEIEREMSRVTRPFDAHPAPKERIALLERLAEDERLAVDDRPAENVGQAWALIDDPAALQAEMMGVVTEGLREQPVRAPDQTVERPPREEQPVSDRRQRVRFYTGLLTLLGAILLGAAYIPSKRLSSLVWANALALVSIWTSFGPIVRARVSR
jgi:Zn-dependent protease with chaperone function